MAREIEVGQYVKLYTWDELIKLGFEVNEAEEGFPEEMIFENLDLPKPFFDLTNFDYYHRIVYKDEDNDFKIIKDNYTVPNEMIKEVYSKTDFLLEEVAVEEITANKTIHTLRCGFVYYNYQGNHFRLFSSMEICKEWFETEDSELVMREFESDQEMDVWLLENY